MLKGISPLLSPELLKVLDEMGHGDEIVFADANFPTVSTGKRIVRADGIGAVEMPFCSCSRWISTMRIILY